MSSALRTILCGLPRYPAAVFEVEIEPEDDLDVTVEPEDDLEVEVEAQEP